MWRRQAISPASRRVVIAPPFTSLVSAVEAARYRTAIRISAQNLYFERDGAFTGEASGDDGFQPRPAPRSSSRFWMTRNAAGLFGDSRMSGRRGKPRAAILTAKLTPIVCIGESSEERERHETLAVLDRQIRGALDGCTGDEIGSLVMAHEPVWAIGTGKNATPVEVKKKRTPIFVDACVNGSAAAPADACAGFSTAGSVKQDNIQEIIGLEDVDGAPASVAHQSRSAKLRRNRAPQPHQLTRPRAGGVSARPRGRCPSWRDGAFCDRGWWRYTELLCAYYLSSTIYVVACLFLLVVVLLQQGKGGDIAAAFGGSSSQTAFGARAGATVLTRATTIFGQRCSCLALWAWPSSRRRAAPARS